MKQIISIIVPVYNTEKYLRECIESILNQTYKHFELILVDDGSTDSSWKICLEYQQTDKRVRAFHKENTGVSATRNWGLSKANGEYISFCDSDDIIKANLYEILLDKLVEYNVDRVCGGYEYLYSGRKLYCKARMADGLYQMKDILPVMIDDGTMSGFLFSGVCNSIFKNEIISKNNIRFVESVKYNEDGLFSFEYALHSQSLYSLQSVPLYLYRQHDMSSTNKRTEKDNYSTLHEKLREMDFDKIGTNFDLQMHRRIVTEALWKILDISANKNGVFAIRDINDVLDQERMTKNIDVIKVVDLNIYKRIYYILMKRKMALLLYFISRKLVPFFSKYLSR